MTDSPGGVGDRSGDELARSLRALRAAAGVDQIPAAEAAGIGQATLSRAERGQGALRPDKLARLLTAYGVADEGERERLLALARIKRDERIDARVILQAGAHHVQARIHELEEGATQIRAYQPGAVFWVMQTTDYMGAVFSQRGADQTQVVRRVAERTRRRTLLDSPLRTWTLIQTEGALRWHLHSPAAMLAQLGELVEASRRPNVRLGVVDWRTPTNFLAMHGFHVYDGHTVQVGTRDGTAFLTDSDKVADYVALFDLIQSAAVFGDEFRMVVAQVIKDFETLST